MAGSSLLVLLDDIATVLDDVAAFSKLAAKKSAGLLGDDLAVNAEQVSGLRAKRELPVIWAVARGSLRNKLILVPAALLISAVLPWLISPVLMLGGLYLCYEGFEKLAHPWLHPGGADERERHELSRQLADPAVDPVALEKQRIRGAIRTDFILSAEIIVITLGTVADAAFGTRFMVVSAIALLMTIGVYGLVAAIIKLDDAGLYLSEREGSGVHRALVRRLGDGLLAFAPLLMKTLAVVGTIAMFMVGGGILAHGLHPVAVLLEHLVASGATLPAVGPLVELLGFTLLAALLGVVAGGVSLGLLGGISRLYRRD